jgi:methylmalonyl-CoA mutase cobalamin-binding subunit
MLDILQELKQNFHVEAVKAEFEAEGTRSDEFLRLLEISRRVGLKVALKIGGAEAIRDLFEAQQYGVDYIIAPMVETPYALSKYMAAINASYEPSCALNTEFLFNLETGFTFKNFNDMLELVKDSKVKLGVVFGRVDFTQSLGLSRAEINSEQITQYCLEVAKKCQAQDLPLVVGGGVSAETFKYLKAINELRLDRFETRKIVFSSELLSTDRYYKALDLAVKFELLWLKNKQQYYSRLAQEDAKRIEMLEKRCSDIGHE